MFIIWKFLDLWKKKKDKKKENGTFTLFVYDWESGSLTFDKFEFDSLEEAITYAQTLDGIIKIYDPKGKLAHFERRENDDNPY